MFITALVGSEWQRKFVSQMSKHDQVKAMLPSATTQISINIYQYITIFNEILWNFMKFYEILWYFMKFYEMLWNFMKFYEILWNFMKFYEILWNFMKFYEILWHFMKFYEILWYVTKFHGIKDAFVQFCSIL